MTAAWRRGAHDAPLAPSVLAALLGRHPSSPGGLVAAIGVYEELRAFERIVRDLWPQGEQADSILGARRPGERRESTRVWAFVERCSADYFPLQPCEEYAEVIGEIPFERLGFSYDDVEEYNGGIGYLLLLIAVLGDTIPGFAAHCDALHEEASIAETTFAAIPAGQRTPDRLAAALDGTPYAATTDLARWLYDETGSCFLDLTWEMQLLDNDGWTPAFIDELRAQWRAAAPLIARVDALATLLESDPDAHFAALLRALGTVPGSAVAGAEITTACTGTGVGEGEGDGVAAASARDALALADGRGDLAALIVRVAD